MLGRVFINTFKQIKRSGWVTWASVAVMTLAFFVATVFAGLAFLSNLYIQFIETRDNMLVFFEVGSDNATITRLKDKWEDIPQIKSIGFTSEEDAYTTYLSVTTILNPIEHKILSESEIKRLPSSLDIKLTDLESLNTVKNIINKDIEVELETMVYDPEKEVPILLITDDKSLDEYRTVFSYLRAGGTIILVTLFIIIFFFTLTTVEFRIYNRMEEIGVMQLVGGSLAYIRAPYILEGAFHGVVGAAISTFIIGGVLLAIFQFNAQPELQQFIYNRIAALNLPQVDAVGWFILIAIKLGIGFFIGSFSSFLAIRRYIK